MRDRCGLAIDSGTLKARDDVHLTALTTRRTSPIISTRTVLHAVYMLASMCYMLTLIYQTLAPNTDITGVGLLLTYMDTVLRC